MLELEEYTKIKKLLNKKEYNKLDEYLLKLYNLSYLKNAREALIDYLSRYNSFYGYLNQRIVISNSYSAYILNNDEILTDYRKKRLKVDLELVNKLEQIKMTEDSITEMNLKEGIKIKNCLLSDINYEIKVDGFYDKKIYKISDNDDNFYYFDVKLFNFSKKFLGLDTKYSLYKDMLYAESEKGKGFIMGLKKNK